MTFRGALPGLLRRIGALDPRDRRALVLGSLVVASAMGYAGIVRPLMADFANAKAQLSSQRSLLERELALVRDAPSLRLRYHEAETAVLAEAPRLFSGTDALAASAALVRYVTDLAYHSHVFVQGTETRPATLHGEGVIRLTADLHLVGDMAGLTSWLRSVEQGQKLVRVVQLRIAPAERLSSSSSAPPAEVLGVAVEIQGLMLATDGRRP